MRASFAIPTVLLLAAFAAGAGGATAAQSKEKPASQDKTKQAGSDKTRQAKEAPKVYTDEDLKKAREDPSSNVTVLGSPDAPPPSPDPEAEQAPGMPSDRDLDEATWKAMAAQAWGTVRAAEARIRELEAQIQELLLGDRNPNPPDLLDPSRLQKREAARVDAEKKLAEARIQLTAAQQGVESLQERARAAAVPQSWVEEPAPEPEPQS